MLDFPESRDKPALMSKNRAARVVNLTRKQMDNMVRGGHVQTLRTGGRVYVVTSSLEQLRILLNHGGPPTS